MVDETEATLRNDGLGGKLTSSSKKWNQVQLWKTIKQIVEKKSIPYDDLLFKAFSGDNEALRALIEEEILALHKENGVRTLTAYSTLYNSAFKKMVESPKLRIALDILEKKADLTKDMDEISKVEDELVKLARSESDSSSRQIDVESLKKRRETLFLKLLELNPKAATKEKEIKDLELQLKSWV